MPLRRYAYNSLNEMEAVTQGPGQTEYTYDFRGNLASRTVKGTPDQVTTYTFDGANRLTKVDGPTGTVSYGYDFTGQRVAESGPNGVTWYVFDGLSVLLEVGSDRKARAALVPGVSRTRLDLTEPLTEWYLHDGLGSVVMLTDVLGNPTQEYWYAVFGAVRNVVRDPFNRYRFVGLAHDDVTGLIYMNARWYDPAVGRFVSRDPLRGDPTSSQAGHRYVYAGNDPLGAMDITGLSLCRIGLRDLADAILDDAFAPSVRKWISLSEKEKITLSFSSAFRSTERQEALAKDPKATTPATGGTSLHEAGFAVDINWSKLPDKEKDKVKTSAREAGLSWGGDFGTPDPVHFYHDPGNRDELIRKSQEEHKKGVSKPCP